MYDDSDKRTSLINDQARVYKGGSWKDRAYWLDPAQRRFYQKNDLLTLLGLDVLCQELVQKMDTEPRKEIKKI